MKLLDRIFPIYTKLVDLINYTITQFPSGTQSAIKRNPIFNSASATTYNDKTLDLVNSKLTESDFIKYSIISIDPQNVPHINKRIYLLDLFFKLYKYCDGKIMLYKHNNKLELDDNKKNDMIFNLISDNLSTIYCKEKINTTIKTKEDLYEFIVNNTIQGAKVIRCSRDNYIFSEQINNLLKLQFPTSRGGGYKSKYLKYKTKYLELKKLKNL